MIRIEPFFWRALDPPILQTAGINPCRQASAFQMPVRYISPGLTRGGNRIPGIKKRFLLRAAYFRLLWIMAPEELRRAALDPVQSPGRKYDMHVRIGCPVRCPAFMHRPG